MALYQKINVTRSTICVESFILLWKSARFLGSAAILLHKIDVLISAIELLNTWWISSALSCSTSFRLSPILCFQFEDYRILFAWVVSHKSSHEYCLIPAIKFDINVYIQLDLEFWLPEPSIIRDCSIRIFCQQVYVLLKYFDVILE